jgi:hypothetical protein
MLTQERLKELLFYDPDTGIFTWRVNRGRGPGGCTLGGKLKGKVAGSLHPDNRIFIHIDRRMYGAHRLAFLYVYGRWPEPEVDHIDRDMSNNRISNLREATRRQQNGNRRANIGPAFPKALGGEVTVIKPVLSIKGSAASPLLKKQATRITRPPRGISANSPASVPIDLRVAANQSQVIPWVRGHLPASP